jgi:hypothetical protein
MQIISGGLTMPAGTLRSFQMDFRPRDQARQDSGRRGNDAGDVTRDSPIPTLIGKLHNAISKFSDKKKAGLLWRSVDRK